MASRSAWNEFHAKHEGWATSLPLSVWYLVGPYLVEDDAARYSVYVGMTLVAGLRAVCWQIFGWERYLGLDTSTPEQYPSIDSPGLQGVFLTLPERFSVWLVALGYLVAGFVELDMGLAHGFAGGIAASIGTSVAYRRIRNIELPSGASDP